MGWKSVLISNGGGEESDGIRILRDHPDRKAKALKGKSN